MQRVRSSGGRGRPGGPAVETAPEGASGATTSTCVDGQTADGRRGRAEGRRGRAEAALLRIFAVLIRRALGLEREGDLVQLAAGEARLARHLGRRLAGA